MSTKDQSNTAKILRGVVAGVIAGAGASFAMDRFQAAVSTLSASDDDSEPTTDKAARQVARTVTDHDIPAADRPLAGQAIHYTLGIGLGVAYALAAEFKPTVTAGHGAAFGIITATLLDEAAVPAAGLGDPPWQADVATTLYGYASHLIFGSVTEAVRSQVAKTLSPT